MSSMGKRHFIFREGKIKEGVSSSLSFLWQTVMSLLLVVFRTRRFVWVAMKFIIIHLCSKNAIGATLHVCHIYNNYPNKTYSHKWLTRTPTGKRDYFSLLDHISKLRIITVHKPNTTEHSLLMGGTVTFSLENAYPQGPFDKSIHNPPNSPEVSCSFTMLKNKRNKCARYLEVWVCLWLCQWSMAWL